MKREQLIEKLKGLGLTDEQIESLNLAENGMAFSEEMKEGFALDKVKVKSNGGVEIEFTCEMRKDGQIFKDVFVYSSDLVPHPDLINAINEMKPFLAQCFGVITIKDFQAFKSLKAKEKQAVKDLAKIIDTLTVTRMEAIEVSGCSLSGDDDKIAIVMTGKMTQANQSKVAINSPRIATHQNTFGFEEDLKRIIEIVNDEAREYIFNNKKAQLELDLEEETPEMKVA